MALEGSSSDSPLTECLTPLWSHLDGAQQSKRSLRESSKTMRCAVDTHISAIVVPTEAAATTCDLQFSREQLERAVQKASAR